MRYLLIVVLVIGAGYGAYKWYDTKNAAASESEIVRLLQKGEANRTPQENKILDEYTKNWNEKKFQPALDKEAQKLQGGQVTLSMTKAAPTEPYSTNMCAEERIACTQFLNLEKTPPANTILSKSTVNGIVVCKEIAKQCQSLGF